MLLSAIVERRLTPTLTRLDIENVHARASLSLFGGQLLSFVPKHDGRERLFLSERAHWDGSQPIRGGIPICWPWFGAHKDDNNLPSHGYVRTRPWRLLENRDEDEHTRLILEPEDCSGAGLDGSATLRLEVLVGRSLHLHLHTTNTGQQPFRLTTALHSYFLVDDVRACMLEGLHGIYSDKTRDWAQLPTPTPYRFTGETDRIHLCTPGTVRLIEGDTRTVIGSCGHDSLVVWSPWSARSAHLPDMGVDDWIRMLCVETAVTQGMQLAPGASHCLSQTIS